MLKVVCIAADHAAVAAVLRYSVPPPLSPPALSATAHADLWIELQVTLADSNLALAFVLAPAEQGALQAGAVVLLQPFLPQSRSQQSGYCFE
jgi:hypothetical protein